MRVLFICNQNIHRSRTAEELFKDMFETKSAGLFNENPVSAKEISWADTVVVMEEEQRIELVKRFPQLIMSKRLISFDVPDAYSYQQPELVELLKSKVGLL